MENVIVITSGKGGVGKTTSTANLGTGLAMQGKKVVLVDTDIGLRNLDVVLGLENRIVYDLVDVVEGTCKLKQALIKDKRYEGLYLLPAAQTRNKMAVAPEQMKELVGGHRARLQERGGGGKICDRGHGPGGFLRARRGQDHRPFVGERH